MKSEKEEDVKSVSNRYLNIFKIVGIALLCLSLVVLSYNFTVAWFMDDSTTSNSSLFTVVGTIDLDVTTNFDIYNLALAPDTIYEKDQNGADIGTYIRTKDSTNNGDHDIKEVYIRIKPTIARDDGESGSIDCTEFSLYFASGTLTTSLATAQYQSSDSNKWVFNSADGYYYYLGGVGSTSIRFNAGYQTNNRFNNSIAGLNVDIHFEIEGIQRPYGAYKAEWTTAPDLFNSFALQDSGV